jgi:hypothetical protein
MFNDMLKTQLILKNIVTPEDWEIMSEHIQYDFLYDNHFSELKDAELLTERLNMVQMAEPYVGKYFSQDYLRRKVLRQTDQEIVEQDLIIKKEIEDGIIPDPNALIDPNTGQPMDPNAMGQMPAGPESMNLGAPIMEPDLAQDSKAVEPPSIKTPKGGEI